MVETQEKLLKILSDVLWQKTPEHTYSSQEWETVIMGMSELLRMDSISANPGAKMPPSQIIAIEMPSKLWGSDDELFERMLPVFRND